MESAPDSGNRLRDHRLASGLTQADLAERAGVSRQLIAAAETGHNTPAVDAAIRLAHALGSSVEALFAPAPRSVLAALDEPLRRGRPLRVGRVGDQLVAAELPDHGTAGSGWARPDAILDEAGGLRLFERAEAAGIVLAGCDPAIGVAEAMLQGLGARSLLALPAPTGRALRALANRTIHAAVVHGPADGLPAAPVPVLRLHLARWQVGVAGAPGLDSPSLAAVLEAGIPVVQRDDAAASQQAFARATVAAGFHAPPGPQAAGLIDAARTASLLDCAAVTTEAAARAFALPFIALEEHTVEVWVADQWATHPAFVALAELLSSRAFTDRISQFAGYELAGCGSRI
jgi:transcriptional regulator with XRE-family HTH domain